MSDMTCLKITTAFNVIAITALCATNWFGTNGEKKLTNAVEAHSEAIACHSDDIKQIRKIIDGLDILNLPQDKKPWYYPKGDPRFGFTKEGAVKHGKEAREIAKNLRRRAADWDVTADAFDPPAKKEATAKLEVKVSRTIAFPKTVSCIHCGKPAYLWSGHVKAGSNALGDATVIIAGCCEECYKAGKHDKAGRGGYFRSWKPADGLTGADWNEAPKNKENE